MTINAIGADIGNVPENIRWELKPVPGETETYFIVNCAHRKFLDSHGSKVWLWGNSIDIGTNPDNIKWHRKAVAGSADAYHLIHVGTNKYLDTHGSKLPNTSDVWVYQLKGASPRSKNLQWRFLPVM